MVGVIDGGEEIGTYDGMGEGCCVGSTDGLIGLLVGAYDGPTDGCTDGLIGPFVGAFVGDELVLLAGG